MHMNESERERSALGSRAGSGKSCNEGFQQLQQQQEPRPRRPSLLSSNPLDDEASSTRFNDLLARWTVLQQQQQQQQQQRQQQQRERQQRQPSRQQQQDIEPGRYWYNNTNNKNNNNTNNNNTNNRNNSKGTSDDDPSDSELVALVATAFSAAYQQEADAEKGAAALKQHEERDVDPSGSRLEGGIGSSNSSSSSSNCKSTSSFFSVRPSTTTTTSRLIPCPPASKSTSTSTKPIVSSYHRSRAQQPSASTEEQQLAFREPQQPPLRRPLTKDISPRSVSLLVPSLSDHLDEEDNNNDGSRADLDHSNQHLHCNRSSPSPSVNEDDDPKHRHDHQGPHLEEEPSDSVTAATSRTTTTTTREATNEVIHASSSSTTSATTLAHDISMMPSYATRKYVEQDAYARQQHQYNPSLAPNGSEVYGLTHSNRTASSSSSAYPRPKLISPTAVTHSVPRPSSRGRNRRARSPPDVLQPEETTPISSSSSSNQQSSRQRPPISSSSSSSNRQSSRQRPDRDKHRPSSRSKLLQQQPHSSRQSQSRDCRANHDTNNNQYGEDQEEPPRLRISKTVTFTDEPADSQMRSRRRSRELMGSLQQPPVHDHDPDQLHVNQEQKDTLSRIPDDRRHRRRSRSDNHSNSRHHGNRSRNLHPRHPSPTTSAHHATIPNTIQISPIPHHLGRREPSSSSGQRASRGHRSPLPTAVTPVADSSSSRDNGKTRKENQKQQGAAPPLRASSIPSNPQDHPADEDDGDDAAARSATASSTGQTPAPPSSFSLLYPEEAVRGCMRAGAELGWHLTGCLSLTSDIYHQECLMHHHERRDADILFFMHPDARPAQQAAANNGDPVKVKTTATVASSVATSVGSEGVPLNQWSSQLNLHQNHSLPTTTQLRSPAVGGNTRAPHSRDPIGTSTSCDPKPSATTIAMSGNPRRGGTDYPHLVGVPNKSAIGGKKWELGMIESDIVDEEEQQQTVVVPPSRAVNIDEQDRSNISQVTSSSMAAADDGMIPMRQSPSKNKMVDAHDDIGNRDSSVSPQVPRRPRGSYEEQQEQLVTPAAATDPEVDVRDNVESDVMRIDSTINNNTVPRPWKQQPLLSTKQYEPIFTSKLQQQRLLPDVTAGNLSEWGQWQGGKQQQNSGEELQDAREDVDSNAVLPNTSSSPIGAQTYEYLAVSRKLSRAIEAMAQQDEAIRTLQDELYSTKQRLEQTETHLTESQRMAAQRHSAEAEASAKIFQERLQVEERLRDEMKRSSELLTSVKELQEQVSKLQQQAAAAAAKQSEVEQATGESGFVATATSAEQSKACIEAQAIAGQAKAEAARLWSATQSLRKQVASLTVQLSQAQQAKQSAEQHLQATQAKMAVDRQESARLKDQVSLLRQQVEALKQTSDVSATHAEQEAATLRSEVESIKQQLERSNQTVTERHEKAQHLEYALSESQQESGRLKEQVSEIMRQLAETKLQADQRVAASNAETKQLHNDINAVKFKLFEANAYMVHQAADHLKETQQLEQELQDTQAAADVLQHKLATMDAELFMAAEHQQFQHYEAESWEEEDTPPAAAANPTSRILRSSPPPLVASGSKLARRFSDDVMDFLRKKLET